MRRGSAVLAALLLVGAITACESAEEAPAAPQPPAAEAQTEAPAEETEAAEAPPAASTVDPCSLVTKAEAEKLAGLKMQDARESPESCAYTTPPEGTTGQVEVYVGDGAKKQYDIELQLDHNYKAISGAGDEAYSYQDGLSVFVNKGGVWTSVHLVRIDDPAKYRPALEDLARTMSTRY
ncbi:hypothetical protein GCM10022251_68620 [Phytohabitans flavus]|uniref:DUF3558 domain-containing protein n=1 Tax=Phytohabitans flavus TaxID=1076124 RepID=A0A6F8XQS3_9ACTN|nr:DUF3558 domain-containing protein [Phytohabitans flavus]BCB76192.1 hypothetical protein Pflav_026020 [Phytohabitans flavus]